MVEKINEGRYRVCLNGEPKEIVISFGLKGELYRVISKGQIESFSINRQIFINEDSRKDIVRLNEEIDSLRKTDPNGEQLKALENELEIVYAKAMEDLTVRQQEELFNSTLKKIELTENMIAEGIALLLTERDRTGQIIRLVTRDEVLWNPQYAADSETLIELLYMVVEYLTSALKKISKMKEAIDMAMTDVNQTTDSPIS